MQELRDPLFLGTSFLNIKKGEKPAPAISVRVNLQRDDVIYAHSVKSRMEVYGYIDPATGLFVSESEETGPGSIYHKFRLMAVKEAKEALERFLGTLSGLNEDDYAARGYKPFDEIANGLRACLTDRQGLYADLQKQVNLITSRKFPKVNEYLVFEDDAGPNYPVTSRVPYKNPAGVKLSKKEQNEIDSFLDVFLEPYDKFTLSWYLGAALSNVPLYDDRVSKLAILSSSFGGSGKSTLATGLVNALFTPAYREIKDDFDSFFTMSNRFGTSSLSTKRITVYSEASWNSDPLSGEHNFGGMNVSAIKSMVTEGYVASESKFCDRDMERLSGFHLVLTNHPPAVSDADAAMNRRMLPIMVKPTSMADKARALGLWGRQKMDAFFKEHAQAFAAYFVSVFHSDEYAFSEQEYCYKDYVQDIRDARETLDEEKCEGRKRLDILKADGLLKFLEGVENEHGISLSVLKNDITDALSGAGAEGLSDHLRLDNGIFYLDASKSFLLRYGTGGQHIRRILKDYYGEPVKKYHKRMFKITMGR